MKTREPLGTAKTLSEALSSELPGFLETKRKDLCEKIMDILRAKSL